MGLDSVELVMEVKKYFKIQIPYPEAEKIYTVQDMVDTVTRHLNITSTDATLRSKIFEAITSAIRQLTTSEIEINLEDKASQFVSSQDKENWQNLEMLLDLRVPRPDIFNPNSNKLSDKFKKLINWTPNYDWQNISFQQFTDSICANNYHKLVNAATIKSKYEIYIGVMGITVDKIGVDYFEISPEKSFTSDLGVD